MKMMNGTNGYWPEFVFIFVFVVVFVFVDASNTVNKDILMNENDEWDRWVSNLLLPNDLRATFIIALQLAAFM